MEKRELKHNIPIPSREEGRSLYALIIIGLPTQNKSCSHCLSIGIPHRGGSVYEKVK